MLAIEIEGKAAVVQNEIRILTIQLSDLSLDEAQEQVAYWNTRLAVTEKSVNTAQSRRFELQQSLDRLVIQRAGVQARLDETRLSLNQLDEEKMALREGESGLFQKMEALRVQIEPAEKDLESAEQDQQRWNHLEEHNADAGQAGKGIDSQTSQHRLQPADEAVAGKENQSGQS